MAFFKPGNRKTDTKMLPVTKREPVRRQLSYAIANLQGIGTRTGQEDSFAVANAFDVVRIREEGLFFAVCDGMGGMKDGKLASETAVRCLRQSFLEMDRGGDMAVQLKRSLFQASSQVEALIGGNGGSTAVVGILYQGGLFYASVGDSYFYLMRDGILLRLNVGHNLCQEKYLEAIRDGDMTPISPSDIPEGEALTAFLGMIGLEEADCSVRPLPLQEGDVLLACSDGVGGVLGQEEIVRALQEENVEAMCARLEAGIVAHARTNQDNYTAVVVKCIL